MAIATKQRKDRIKELEDIKSKIFTKLPKLNARQIRRHRIPYYEALCIELEEDDFCETAAYIKALIAYQDNFRDLSGPDTLIWLQPELKYTKCMLDKMYEVLRKAELGVKAENTEIEWINLIQLGINIAQQGDNWLWLAEQILTESVFCVENFKDDSGERNAIARYILGKFLFEKVLKVEEAIVQFKACREISIGQPWTAKFLLNIPQRTVFKECCTLLYKALIFHIKTIMTCNPLKGISISSIAEKRAKDADDIEGQADSLFYCGICHINANDASTALRKLNKALIMYYSINNHLGICESRIQIAVANKRIGNVNEAFYHLQNLLEFTIKNQLIYYKAQAHKFLGELHLARFEPRIATSHFVKAIHIFHDLDSYQNREHSKNFAAISAGEELLDKFKDLLHKCNIPGKEGQESLQKMVAWKDNRDIFWEIDKKLQIERPINEKLITTPVTSDINVIRTERLKSFKSIVSQKKTDRFNKEQSQHLDDISEKPEETEIDVTSEESLIAFTDTEPVILFATDNKDE